MARQINARIRGMPEVVFDLVGCNEMLAILCWKGNTRGSCNAGLADTNAASPLSWTSFSD